MRLNLSLLFVAGLKAFMAIGYIALAQEETAMSLQTPETILAQPEAIEQEKTNPVQAMSRFLAGLPQGKEYEVLESLPNWQIYRSVFETRWSMVEKARIVPMSQWREAALGKVTLPVFYPMGGPDVFNVLTFFPDSPEYILVGLERIGDILTLQSLAREGAAPRIIANLEQGMNSLFQRSFFITKDMSRDFYERGVLPTMLALIARLGYDVLDVKFVSYTPEGKILENPDCSARQGVEITFRKSGAQNSQKLYYFRQNLHNGTIASFARFIEARGSFAVMFKSSSYTPHQVGFSHLVELVEKCGEMILQDDSGIPYSRLKKNWNISLYGAYTKPYGESFQAYVQPELAHIYATDPTIPPLGFRIGYGYGKTPSCIQVARKKVSRHANPDLEIK